MQVDLSVEMDRGFAEAGKPGSLLLSRPEQSRIASFDAKSPFGAAATHTLIAPHLVPAGSMSRRLFANSLAAADTDDILTGGWMLPLGQEDAMRDRIVAFRRLPTGQYETIAGQHEPVVARRLSLGTSTFIYLVNNAPWKCQVTMRTDAADDTPMLELSNRRDVAAPKRGRWSLTLDRYDFVAVRFDRENVNLSDVAVTFNKDVRGLLQQKINDLSDRTVELQRRTVVDVLENPNFELPGADRQMRGWSLVGEAGITAELDPRERHGGAASARLSSKGNVASLISDRFQAPATGRISFTVWLKTSPDFRGPLRLAFGGRHEDREFYRFGVVPPSDQWQVFEFQVDDLPLTELTDTQVRFDLMGQGEVWIDDIAVSDLRFSDNERKELSRILTHAHFALNGGNLEQCARILEGYWPTFLRQHVAIGERSVAVGDRPMRQAEVPQRQATVAPAEEKQPWWKKNLPGFLK